MGGPGVGRDEWKNSVCTISFFCWFRCSSATLLQSKNKIGTEFVLFYVDSDHRLQLGEMFFFVFVAQYYEFATNSAGSLAVTCWERSLGVGMLPVLGALLTGGQHLLASHPPAVAAGPCTEKRTWSEKNNRCTKVITERSNQ
jgi:hypothetical protein